jgi:DNA (cytosine-5)-methyltransferase 1
MPRPAPTFGSLFSGIGGIDLGLERAGWRCAWQVEIDSYARRVLAKHWPDVPRFGDVRTVGAAELQRVDLIAGGFPCQDISVAGKGAGIEGARSGLWREFARIVRELRPRLVLVENVTAIRSRGLGDVLGDLAALGFDAEWDCLPAAAFGAPHVRDRLFVVAYPNGHGLEGILSGRPAPRSAGRGDRGDAGVGEVHRLRELPVHDPHGSCVRVSVPFGGRMVNRPIRGSGRWAFSPSIFRVADGVPGRVDRLRAIGNAVVPDVAEWLGRRLLAAIQPPAEQGDHGVGPCGGRP